MATTAKKARNLDSLDQEIRQLRQKARQLEGKIDDNFTYFQHHSGSLFVRSLLPRKIKGEAITGVPFLDSFLENERLQKILIRLGDRVAEKLGDGINWLVNRVFKQ
jgi:hypothetical protein